MAKKKAAPQETELAAFAGPAASDEQVALSEAMAVLNRLVGDPVAFFTRARELEVSALAADELSKSSKVPTTPEEDEKLQRAIKKANDRKREIEAHWEEPSSTLYGLHRRFTGRRKVSTDALERASARWNQHHNSFVSEQERKAREENERLRKEAEAEAARQRQAELDRLEAARLKAEAESPDLSERELRFVAEVLLEQSVYEAAKLAGYAKPGTMADRLMASPKILEAIEKGKELAALTAQAEAVAAAPVHVDFVPVEAEVYRASGTSRRVNRKAVLEDAAALIEDVFAGRAPRDLLMVDEARLREYGKQLGDKVELWRGVRYTEEGKVV